MKRMVYIIIAVAAIAISGVIVAGCMLNPPTNNPSAITGLSLSQQHMNFRYYYSFYIRQDNNRVLFDADVRFDEEPYEIVLESCEVEKADFDTLLSINEKHRIDDYVIRYKKTGLPFEAQDKTTKKTTLYFTDGTDKSADTSEDYEQELYDFFKNLALKYSNLSVSLTN